MKKNVFRIIIFIIIIFIILVAINVIRNYLILKSISDNSNNIESQLNNYYYEETLVGSSNNTSISSKVEEYSYNGIYLVKSYVNNELNSTIWYDSNADKGFSIDNNNVQNTDINKVFLDDYKNLLLFNNNNLNSDISTILSQTIFMPILKENNRYVISAYDGKFYVNKDTSLIEEISSNNTTKTFSFEGGVVTAEDVERPDNQ